MIAVKLLGGLGNQMFQYAIARTWADKLNTRLILDASEFKAYKLHNYSLDSFRIRAKVVHTPLFQSTLRLLKPLKYLPYSKTIFLRESTFLYDPNLDLPQDHAYLEGYFQTDKYFSNNAPNLRADFKLRFNSDRQNSQLLRQIQLSRNPVSLHVRRGDYVSNTAAQKVHGSLSLSYYKNAIEKLHEKLGDISLFVFSDDPTWVQENLKTQFPTVFVTHNQNKNYEDLNLMANCSHNIIANSTFSWWAAWVNSSPEKVVIAPQKWFNDPSLDSKDLIPKDWYLI